MKNLNFLRYMLGSVLGLSLFMTACARSNKSDNTLKGATDTAAVVGTATYVEKCSNGTSAIGYIYDNGSGNFQNQVAAYLSSFMYPNELGTVDGSPNSTTTGVDLQGKLHFDSNGQIVVSTSSLKISIVDSLTLQGQGAISPSDYSQKAISGSMNATAKTFNVTFQDKYGAVNISGRFDTNYATGTVSFQNTSAVSGYTAQSGTLGAFKISACGLFE